MDTKRQNFINTVKETMEFAEACGERPAQGVLCTLLGAMHAGNETDLLRFLTEWNSRQVEMLSAHKTNQR